jgi:hypothetical protein
VKKRFDAGILSGNPDLVRSIADFSKRVEEDEGIKKLCEMETE